MAYLLRPARPDDAAALMSLRSEAEAWLRTQGTDQWSDPDTGGRALERWRASITAGMTWVVIPQENPGKILATATRGAADMDFWRRDDDPESGLYLYKIIVSRGAAGLNIGGLILDWASRLAELEARKWIRVDVWRTNTGLHRYYESHGFRHVRTESPGHRLSGWLGQRPAGLILTPNSRLIPDASVVPVHPGP